MSSAGSLLTNSRFTAGRIERAYGRRASPVPLGVTEVFRAAPPGQERTHLLSVGSLIPSKGHDLAIRAAAASSGSWPLVVVAPSTRGQESERLAGLARECGVDLEIRVGISDTDLRDLYRAAVATLYLAREEPLGLVSMEAQACGSPVVVSDDGGLPETMIDGETGWIVSREDPHAAARALDALRDADLLAATSERASRHGRAQTWERSAVLVQEALEGAAGR